MTNCRLANLHTAPDSEMANAMLSAIIDSSDDAIISKTVDGVIVTWNAAAERIFGYTPQEAIGKPILMLLPADRADEEQMILSKLRNVERVTQFETVRVTKSGRMIDVSVTISPIKDADGNIIGASKIVRDISEQKRAIKMMRLQHTHMEHLARLNTMGEMTVGLAHELNQPLASILNYAGVSLAELQSDQYCARRMTAALQEVVNETRRAGEIIRRLRAFITKRQPEREPVDVNALIRDSVHLLEHDLRVAEISVCLLLTDQAPIVRADSVQLTQVLVNLIRNARDAMTDPTATGRELVVESSVFDHEVSIDVVDRGCGMPDEQLSRLFDHFFSTKPSGLGMGLPISKAIISSLGGQLTGAINSHGGGMIFRITLPFTKYKKP